MDTPFTNTLFPAEEDDLGTVPGTQPSGQFSFPAEEDDLGTVPGVQLSGQFSFAASPGLSQPLWVYAESDEPAGGVDKEDADLQNASPFSVRSGAGTQNQPGAVKAVSVSRTHRRFPRLIIQSAIVLMIIICGLILAVSRVQSALGSQGNAPAPTSAPAQSSPVALQPTHTPVPTATPRPTPKPTPTSRSAPASMPTQSPASLIPAGWINTFSEKMTVHDHDSLWETDNSCVFQTDGYEETTTGSNYCAHGNTGNSSFSDLYYSIDLSIRQGFQAGLVLRNQDNNYYYFSITTSGKYSFSVHQSVNGGVDTQIVGGSSSAIRQGQGQWNTLTVLAQQNTFLLFINNVHVNTTISTVRGQGIISVAVNGPDQQNVYGDALFRNLVVWFP